LELICVVGKKISKYLLIFIKTIELYRIDLYSKKLIFLADKKIRKSKFKIKIYDLDKDKLYMRSAPLRFIPNLEGITQYSTEKSLYLCGSNQPALHSSQTTGSYLFRYDLENNFSQPSVLVNSAYAHYNPMIVLVNNDILVVIGGKNQIFCEKYSISLNNWRKIPILPEERYQGCLLVSQRDSNLYLFGGTTEGKFNSSILSLNFRSIGGWDRIILKGHDYFLKRVNCICFCFGGEKDNFFICGGETDENVGKDYIVEYQPINKKIRKQFIKSELCKAQFLNQTIIDFDGRFFTFSDMEENIYIIEKKNFNIKVVNTNDISIYQ